MRNVPSETKDSSFSNLCKPNQKNKVRCWLPQMIIFSKWSSSSLDVNGPLPERKKTISHQNEFETPDFH